MSSYVKQVIPMYMGRVGFKHNKKFLNVYSYLIHTNDGYYLYDTGLNALFVTEKEKMLGDLAMFMLVEVKAEELLDQKLRKYGVSGSEIKAVICSHLHFDHCGGLNFFRNMKVPILVQKEEYEDALVTKRSFEYKKEDYSDVRDQLIFVDGDQCVDENEHIQLICTPGHSAGHQSLWLIGKEQKVLLTGDAVYTRESLARREPASYPQSRKRAEASIDRLRILAEKSDIVICGHDGAEYSDREIVL